MSLKITRIQIKKPKMCLVSELPAGTIFCYEMNKGIFIRCQGSSPNAMNMNTGEISSSLSTSDVYILKANLTVECVMK